MTKYHQQLTTVAQFDLSRTAYLTWSRIGRDDQMRTATPSAVAWGRSTE